MADVVDGNLRLDDQRIPFGNDIHQLVPAHDHAPDRKHVEANHLSGVGGADVHPPEHRLGVRKFRYDFEQLGLRVAQVFRHLRHAVIVQLRRLLHLLGDRLPRLRDIGGGFGGLALQPRAAAFQLQVTRLGDQASLDQRRQAFPLLANGVELLAIGLLLRLAAGDLRFKLGDLFS